MPAELQIRGQGADAETGNDYFGARYYSNRFGRWLSADWSSVPVPVPYANLTNPQTLNLYSMVADDPESFADLDGHVEQASQGGSVESGATPTCASQGSAASGTTAGGCSNSTPADNTQLANDEKPQPAQQNSALQFVKDEAKGMGKELYNTLAGIDNLFYSGVNAAAGTNFHVEELKPASPVEKNAMLGTSLALLVVPESKIAKVGEVGVALREEKIAKQAETIAKYSEKGLMSSAAKATKQIEKHLGIMKTAAQREMRGISVDLRHNAERLEAIIREVIKRTTQ